MVTMRFSRLRTLAVAGAVLVSACASIPFTPPDEPKTVYGSYLAARYAGAVNDAGSAATYYRQALALDPDNPRLIERAFATALSAGDMAVAVELAEDAVDIEPADRLARIVLASDALKDGRADDARALLEGKDLGPFNRVIGFLLLAWSIDAQGETQAALDTLDDHEDSRIVRDLALLHRALILDRAERYDEAEAAYQAAITTGMLRSVVVDAYGRRLERSGRLDDARTLYQTHLIDAPGDPVAKSGLARIAANDTADSALAPTIAAGASKAIYAPAATLATNTRSELAIVYLRLALYLDEGNGAARYLLGELLRLNGRIDEARDTLDPMDSQSPYFAPAQVAAAWTFVTNDAMETASERLELLVARTSDRDARIALADVYRGLERYGDGAELYDELIGEDEAAGEPPDWRLYHARAICFERTDRFDLAVADFQTALSLSPDEPEVLNYLGYSWVDRGENLEEAFAMIRRAVALRPDAGHIIDSLGWAHFKLGEYQQAVVHLERAVEIDPQDPVINDHLGDAYWRVGRAIEAVYQWNRALSLDPEDDDAALIEIKLAEGLPVVDRPDIVRAP